MSHNLTVASFATILAYFALTPAYAADAPRKDITVSFADLDLNTEAGRAELKKRLNAAAGDLCSPVLSLDKPGSDQSVHEHRVLYNACIGRLTNRALASIGTSNRLVVGGDAKP